MKSIRFRIFTALLLSMLIAVSACAADIPVSTREVFSMDTYMTVTCYGDEAEAAADEAAAEIRRLNDLLSVGLEDSEITQLNRNGSAVLSEDSATMLDIAFSVYASSEGAYDITVLPIMRLWGFAVADVTTGDNIVEAITERNQQQVDSFRVPSPEAIADTLAYVGMDRLNWDRETRALTLDVGQGIDLGGIAKGYTSDQLAKVFRKHNLASALISLGGNVYCYGTKVDGSLWKVGIQSPYDPSGIAGIVRVADTCVITSGSYERYFIDEVTGKKYHHIIDPSTGYPAESGLLSVTIVSKNGTLADTLSTACFVMGLDRASDYWRKYGSDFEMIIMTENDELYISEGLETAFTSDKYPVSIIRRDQ